MRQQVIKPPARFAVYSKGQFVGSFGNEVLDSMSVAWRDRFVFHTPRYPETVTTWRNYAGPDAVSDIIDCTFSMVSINTLEHTGFLLMTNNTIQELLQVDGFLSPYDMQGEKPGWARGGTGGPLQEKRDGLVSMAFWRLYYLGSDLVELVRSKVRPKPRQR